MAGLATSYFVAMVMTIRESPVVAVAELVIRLTPGALVERAIRLLGHHDKTFLVIVLLVILGLLFAWAGRLARRSWWKPLTVFAAIAGLGLVAIAVQYDPQLTDVLPILVGFVTWVVCLSVLTDALRSEERRAARAAAADPGDRVEPRRPARRGFLLGAGLMAVASVGVVVLGRVLGQGRRHVEETRRLLRLPGVSEPERKAYRPSEFQPVDCTAL